MHNRELLLNNNLLRVLPYEIGKLFHLHILGLHGNPLGKDVMSIYNDPNGTQKLLTYMLDNLSGELFIVVVPTERCDVLFSYLQYILLNWVDLWVYLVMGVLTIRQ